MEHHFSDEPGRTARAGILDCHVHLPWSGNAVFSGFGAAVAYAKRAGVTGMLFNSPCISWGGDAAAEQLDESNRRALEIAESDPGFLRPSAAIHPALPEESAKWLKRFRERGLPWVGELLSSPGFEFDSPAWLRLFDICRGNGHIVQLHGTPDVLPLARKMPGLKIVQSHLTTRFWPPMDDQLATVAECPDVMLDISGFGGLRLGGLEFAMRHFGADRILFGTDFSVYGPELFITRVRQAFPDPEIQAKIFRDNLLALLSASGFPALF